MNHYDNIGTTTPWVVQDLLYAKPLEKEMDDTILKRPLPHPYLQK